MSNLQNIQDNRDFLFLAEIYALLHDLGKISEEFIKQQSIDSSIDEHKFNHQDILKTKTSKYDYSNFLSNEFKKSFSNKILLNIINKDLTNYKNKYLFDQKLNDQKDIIEKHNQNYRTSGIGLIKLLVSIDGLDSGVDKGVLNDNGKQPKVETYQSTGFGYEKNKIGISNLKSVRDNLCVQLTNCLDNIAHISEKCKNKEITQEEYMSGLIEIRKKILDMIKDAFLKGLGDTRRSGNDVTLWDHSYSVASLYKSALAKIIYEKNLTEPKDIKWRIIAVQYDKMGLAEKAHKLGDIVGYRDLTEQIDIEVKKIIEEEIPVGNEIYRDETGIYFVCPDIKDNEILNSIKQKIIEKSQDLTNGEVIPYITQSESSRSLIILTKCIKEAKHNFQNNLTIPKWTENWGSASTNTVNDSELESSDYHYRSFCINQCNRDNCLARKGKSNYQIDICPICGIHPKCEHQNICKNCLKRRKKRIIDWTNEKYQTIWIDEIADKNNKVAIVTGKFDLMRWLNGEFLNSVFSQTLGDHKETFKNWNINNWNDLQDKLEKCLSSNEDSLGILKTIAGEAYLTPQAFYDNIVADRNPQFHDDAKIDWTKKGDCEKEAEYLLLTLFRKHPSPARLRRIWTSTEKFWEEVKSALKTNNELYSSKEENNRFKRIEIKLNSNTRLIKTLYRVGFDDIDLIMYYDGTKLISVQNLEFTGLSKEKELSKYKDKEILIKRDEESNFEFKEEIIEYITEISWGTSYRPFLDILLSPISFQFIIPARSIPEVLKFIQNKYLIEMGEVYGRLPLNIGLVIFDYKTALYAAINASRKIFQDFEDKIPEQFLVHTNSNGENVEFINTDNKRKLKFNKTTENSSIYYRNFYTTNNLPIENRESYFKSFIGCTSAEMLNASKLDKNDTVTICTNHLDFEFLDTTARRLEIGYDKYWKRTGQNKLKGSRPYYLEEFNTIFKVVWELFDRLNTSQIKKIQSMLAKLHIDWNGFEESAEFKTQIQNILINIGMHKWWDSIDEDKQELLIQVCLEKTIFDILEFYTTILKLKPRGDIK